MNDNTPIPFAPSSQENEIILYQPDSTVKLEVRLENDTVWLTQQQMSDLFLRDRTVITRHINNIFKEKELEEESNVHFLHIANSDKPIKLYSLDVIISVGYRVKSIRGTQFRQWANKVLKEYLLRGYSINQRLLHIESRIDHRLSEHDHQIKELSGKVDFFLRTSLPPKEGILFDGQIFDAYLFVCDLVKRAKKRIVLIDNYIDETVLTLLDKRHSGVLATIYTRRISRQLQLDIERHNDQYPPIDVRTAPDIHDRFMVIDDTLYHIGASIKDLGLKLFAFSRMETPPAAILDNL
ncbi:MAG: virulence RhuM family protein [Muribaculaceae bacterium]|nr:virulence RhuM family protein [Muribaculaceae bacterium]